MRFWYSTDKQELESLSVLIGQKKTDKLNEELIDELPLPASRWGTIRVWGGGFILDHDTEYETYSDLSTLDIKLNELIK